MLLWDKRGWRVSEMEREGEWRQQVVPGLRKRLAEREAWSLCSYGSWSLIPVEALPLLFLLLWRALPWAGAPREGRREGCRREAACTLLVLARSTELTAAHPPSPEVWGLLRPRHFNLSDTAQSCGTNIDCYNHSTKVPDALALSHQQLWPYWGGLTTLESTIFVLLHTLLQAGLPVVLIH